LRLSAKFSASATTSISGSWPSTLRIALRITGVSSASRTLIHIVDGGGTLSTFRITNVLLPVYYYRNVGHPTVSLSARFAPGSSHKKPSDEFPVHQRHPSPRINYYP